MKKPGRPANPIPEPIPDTPENIAQAIFATPPKKRDEWKFIQKLKKIDREDLGDSDG